jgi:hypothetical protein
MCISAQDTGTEHQMILRMSLGEKKSVRNGRKIEIRNEKGTDSNPSE